VQGDEDRAAHVHGVDEALVELETDKVDVEVSAPKAGVLTSIAHDKGADVKIGDVLGTIEDGGTKDTKSAKKNNALRRKRESPCR